MNINELISTISQMTPEKVIAEMHKLVAAPSVLIVSILAILIMGLLGFFVSGNKKKYITLWIIFSILMSLITIGVILLPNTIQIIANLFRS